MLKLYSALVPSCSETTDSTTYTSEGMCIMWTLRCVTQSFILLNIYMSNIRLEALFLWWGCGWIAFWKLIKKTSASFWGAEQTISTLKSIPSECGAHVRSSLVIKRLQRQAENSINAALCTSEQLGPFQFKWSGTRGLRSCSVDDLWIESLVGNVRDFCQGWTNNALNPRWLQWSCTRITVVCCCVNVNKGVVEMQHESAFL